jgi:hypothetical protein
MEYHADGSCTPFTQGQTIEGLTFEGDVYLYYELENHALTFYADAEGREVLRTDTVYYGTSLSDYQDFAPPARPNDTFAAWATQSLPGNQNPGSPAAERFLLSGICHVYGKSSENSECFYAT